MNPTRCRDCAWFKPYAPNPTAAMGECTDPNEPAGAEYWFAGELHRCGRFVAKGGDHAANEA